MLCRSNGAAIPPIVVHPGLMSDEIQTFSASEIVTFDICRTCICCGSFGLSATA